MIDVRLSVNNWKYPAGRKKIICITGILIMTLKDTFPQERQLYFTKRRNKSYDNFKARKHFNQKYIDIRICFLIGIYKSYNCNMSSYMLC